MPSLKRHIELSIKRTGKEYKEIHEWMDGGNVSYRERLARHDISNIPKFLCVVETQFGKDGIREYLQHIKDDYEKSVVLKIFSIIKKLKFW